MRGLKLSNKYMGRFPNFSETPKAVIAAIAYSFAMQLSEDDFDAAVTLCAEEWKILHLHGIVPQKPKSRWRFLNKQGV